MECPDCESPVPFMDQGNGKCRKCYGTGDNQVSEVIGAGMFTTECENCDGSGDCPTCNGTGVIDD